MKPYITATDILITIGVTMAGLGILATLLGAPKVLAPLLIFAAIATFLMAGAAREHDKVRNTRHNSTAEWERYTNKRD